MLIDIENDSCSYEEHYRDLNNDSKELLSFVIQLFFDSTV